MHSLAKDILPQRVFAEIDRVIGRHNRHRAGDNRKVCSTKTQEDRRMALLLSYGQLWEMGFHLQHPDAIREKHIKALMSRWDQEGLAAGTLQTRLSYLRTLAGWLKKPQVVGALEDYLPKERWTRKTVATKNKAWVPNGVQPPEIITQAGEIDTALAAMLNLQHQFGLRVKESIEFWPEKGLSDDGKQIHVTYGTKGGRPRFIPIKTPEQRDAYEFALKVASRHRGGRLRWPGLTWPQARSRYYNWARRQLGISTEGLGVTSHGMRHGFVHTRYSQFSGGLPTPIEGGALGRIDRATHARAALYVSQEVGHNRTGIFAMYGGSYGHSLRTAPAITKVDPFRWV